MKPARRTRIGTSAALCAFLAAFGAFFSAASASEATPGWGRDPAYPVFLSVAVQSTLPASFVIETLQPTLTRLRTALPAARIGHQAHDAR